MKILMVNSSGKNNLSLAVYKDFAHIITYEDFSASNQSEILLESIDKILNEAKISLNDLNAISFVSGPSKSFTAIRLCASIMKGISFSIGMPIISISSLFSIAYSILSRSKIYSTVFPLIKINCFNYYIGAYKKIGDNYINVVDDYLLDIRSHECVKNFFINCGITVNGKYLILGETENSSFLSEIKEYTATNLDISFHTVNCCSVNDLLDISTIYYKNGKVLNCDEVMPIYIYNNFLNLKG